MEYVKLKEIVDIYLGLTHTPKYVDNGIPFLSVKNISKGKIDFSQCHYISSEEYERLPQGAKPQKGDMIFCRVGTIGKPLIIEENIEKFGSFVSLGFFRNKNPNYLLEYLKYWMDSNLFLKQVKKNVKGVAQVNLNTTWLKEFVIPKRSIEAQKEIVFKLNKIQKIIDLNQTRIDLADKFIKYKFIEMFGDPILNEKNWIKVPLGKECNIITGNTPSRNKKEYYGDFIEWIKSDNINTPSNYITQAEEYLSEEGESVGRTIKEDSILMTCIAGSIGCIGNVAMTDRKVAFNQQINGIETLKHNTIFMYVQFLLSKKYIQSTVNMSLKGILSKGKLSELEFIFPPIELQNQFAEIVKQIDRQKEKYQEHLKKSQELMKALMNQYFN